MHLIDKKSKHYRLKYTTKNVMLSYVLHYNYVFGDILFLIQNNDRVLKKIENKT